MAGTVLQNENLNLIVSQVGDDGLHIFNESYILEFFSKHEKTAVVVDSETLAVGTDLGQNNFLSYLNYRYL